MRPDLDGAPQGRVGSALSAPPTTALRLRSNSAALRTDSAGICATSTGCARLRVWPRPSPCFRAAVAASERPGRLAPLLHRPPRGVRFAACLPAIAFGVGGRRLALRDPPPDRALAPAPLITRPAHTFTCRVMAMFARACAPETRPPAADRWPARPRTNRRRCRCAPAGSVPRFRWFGRFHVGAAPSMPLSCGSQPPAGPSRVTRIHVPRDRPAAATRHRRAASASPRQRDCGS